MRVTRTAIVVVMLLGVASAARAQAGPGPVSRVDLSGSAGWLNVDKSEIDASQGRNDWYNRSLYGGATLGWYWTDHWKTEIEGGISSAGEVLVYSPIVIDGHNTTLYSTYRFSTRRFAVSQQYQFFRNVWFHPFVGGGLDLTSERTDRNDEAYSSQPIRPQVYPTRTAFLARPFATVGFKAYVSPKAFFRTDMKFAFDHGVDEVLVRIGVGVDF